MKIMKWFSVLILKIVETMNQNQYLNGKTLLLGILGILLLGLSGCTSKTPSLKGSWEMFVGQDPSLIGQEYGADIAWN